MGQYPTHDDKCERCGECLGCAGIPSPCEPREGMIELHMSLPTTPEIEETRMAIHAALEEAEAIALDLVGLMPTNKYARTIQNAVQDAIDALSDLAEAITGDP